MLASTPECIDQTAASYAADYATVFGEIEKLAPPASNLLALTVYNNWLGHPDLKGLVSARDATRITTLTKRSFDAWNAMLCATAARSRFRCVDLYRAFNGVKGDQPAGDNLGGDHTHPSQQGNDVVADLLTKTKITIASG